MKEFGKLSVSNASAKPPYVRQTRWSRGLFDDGNALVPSLPSEREAVRAALSGALAYLKEDSRSGWRAAGSAPSIRRLLADNGSPDGDQTPAATRITLRPHDPGTG